jgi:diguanylate cyclase (GGDEF)-like protein
VAVARQAEARHREGDRVLEISVRVIRVHVQPRVCGCWGSEEFGLALLNTDAAQTQLIARQICQTLVVIPLTSKDGQPLQRPTVRQSIATVPTHTPNAATLVDLADVALSRAKVRRRDQVCVTGE